MTVVCYRGYEFCFRLGSSGDWYISYSTGIPIAYCRNTGEVVEAYMAIKYVFDGQCV